MDSKLLYKKDRVNIMKLFSNEEKMKDPSFNLFEESFLNSSIPEPILIDKAQQRSPFFKEFCAQHKQGLKEVSKLHFAQYLPEIQALLK